MQLPPIGYMPELLPDESLYSLLARTSALNAIGPPRYFAKLLFGASSSIPSHDLPAHLEHVHQALGPLSPAPSGRELLILGSLFPYYQAFLPAGRSEAVSNLLLGSGGSAAKLLLGMVASRFGAAHRLRYCNECVTEDISDYGTSYWHRAHQLPEVTCCAKHAIPLSELQTHEHYTNRQVLHVPPGQVVSPPQANTVTARTLSFAQLSEQFLSAQLPNLGTKNLIRAYTLALSHKGLYRSVRQQKFSLLASALRDFHQDFDGFPHANRLLSSPKTPLAWLQTIFERPERSVHPVCHLVLIEFLFGDIDSLLVQLKQAIPAVESYRPPVRSTDPPPTEARADALLNPSLSCRQASRLVGVSVTTVVSERRRYGIAISERPKLINTELREKIRTSIARGCDARSIASALDVSLTAVYRIRHESPDLCKRASDNKLQDERCVRRARWERALNTDSVIARKMAAADYAWLHRHDKEWLERLRVGRSRKSSTGARVDWNARDECFAAKLDAFLNSPECLHTKRRISRTMLYQRLGEATVRAHIAQLPRVHAKVLEHAENAFTYGARRIDCAIRELSARGSSLTLWRIRRRSCLRTWTADLEAYAVSLLSEP